MCRHMFFVLCVGAQLNACGKKSKDTPSPTNTVCLHDENAFTSCSEPNVDPHERVPTTPSLNFEERADGCGHITVYKYNATETEGIYIDANRESLALGLDRKAFRIEDFLNDPEYSSLSVHILVSRVGPGDHALDTCTDIRYPTDQPPARWTAVSGEAVITLNPESGSGDLPTGLNNDPYRADVELKHVIFRNESGDEVTLPELKFADAFVGWLAG